MAAQPIFPDDIHRPQTIELAKDILRRHAQRARTPFSPEDRAREPGMKSRTSEHADALSGQSATASARRLAFRAEISHDPRDIETWPEFAGTAFQDKTWLTSWYEMAVRTGAEPLLVSIRDTAGDEIALRLPLVMRHDRGLRVVEFADHNLTDYNGPLLGPAAPTDGAGVATLMKALRRALPPADLLRLAKMPRSLGDKPNPLVLHPAIMDGALSGNLFEIGDDYDAWLHTLGRSFRKDLDRSWRVFRRANDARFERVTDPILAQGVMRALEQQQGERMRALGKSYFLDQPDISRFYHDLVGRGVLDGSVVVTALRAGDEVVAATVGVLGQSGYVLIRLANAGGAWSSCSPGRVVIERTLSNLHEEGCRTFDFSIGDYDYKRRFGARRLPLFDYVAPLGWRGLKAAARARVVGRLRKYPELDARLRAVQAKLTSSA